MLSFRRKPKFYRSKYPKFGNRTMFGIWRSRKRRLNSKTVKNYHKYLGGR